jgi:hypothetical protein
VRLKDISQNVGEFINNEELTPRHMKILVAITFGSIVVFGIVSYLVVFVYLGV